MLIQNGADLHATNNVRLMLQGTLPSFFLVAFHFVSNPFLISLSFCFSLFFVCYHFLLTSFQFFVSLFFPISVFFSFFAVVIISMFFFSLSSIYLRSYCLEWRNASSLRLLLQCRWPCTHPRPARRGPTRQGRCRFRVTLPSVFLSIWVLFFFCSCSLLAALFLSLLVSLLLFLSPLYFLLSSTFYCSLPLSVFIAGLTSIFPSPRYPQHIHALAA